MYLTTARAALMSAYSANRMREYGVPIIDGGIVTQSRWDSCTDGIHYASSFGKLSDVTWSSQVSTMLFHIVLNTVFPDASCLQPAEPEPQSVLPPSVSNPFTAPPAVGQFSTASANTSFGPVQLSQSEFRFCKHSTITMVNTKDLHFSVAQLKRLRLYMHLYTLSNRNGTACASMTECDHLIRPIYLQLSDDGLLITGIVFADPASTHYSFELRVRCTYSVIDMFVETFRRVSDTLE